MFQLQKSDENNYLQVIEQCEGMLDPTVALGEHVNGYSRRDALIALSTDAIYKKKDIKQAASKDRDNFFMPIPDDVFDEMQTAIENYDKNSDSYSHSEDGALTTEMLIALSKKKLANQKK